MLGLGAGVGLLGVGFSAAGLLLLFAVANVDIMQKVRIAEIMTCAPDTVPADLPIGELRRRFETTRHDGFPVVEDDRLLGVVTVSDLPAGSRDVVGDLPLTAGDVCTRQPVTVTPADPVFRALRRMATLDVGRLPVVAGDDHSRVVGLVGGRIW